MSQSIPGKPVFPTQPRFSTRGSTHTTVEHRTALWESLVGKPRGKATDPLIPWTVARQAPLSMEFSRQEYWSELLFHSPGIFPTQGSNPGLPHCKQILYYLSHQAANKSSFCFRGRYYLYLPRLFAIQTSLKTVWGNSYPCSCSEGMQTTTDP